MENQFKPVPGLNLTKVKRFFRIGIVLAEPWAWIDNPDLEENTNPAFVNSSLPNKGLTGYCVELLLKLAEIMDIEFEISLARGNLYGHKMENGTWSGIVGDLISGEIDISVAALTMTTEREEVIDFVSPYFDQVITFFIVLSDFKQLFRVF